MSDHKSTAATVAKSLRYLELSATREALFHECDAEETSPGRVLTDLRAVIAERDRLREALRTVLGILDDPTGGAHVQDMRRAQEVARAALAARERSMTDLPILFVHGCQGE